MSDFAENLRKAMFDKRLKAIDVSNATKITPPTISRYLSRTHQPTTDNLIVISKYLGISPEALLSSSEAPESSESSRYISSDKDKIIAVQEELIKNLQKQVMAQSHYIHALFKNLEEAKAESKERHTKGREKPYAKEWEERKEKKRWEKTREKAKKPKSKKSKK